MGKRTKRVHYEGDQPVVPGRPKRSCRRDINYKEVDEDYDVGFIIETFRTTDYVKRSMGSPPSYALKLGDEEERYNEHEMRSMFNADLIEYLDFRKSRRVSMIDIWRLWLMEETEAGTEEMNIDYIILPLDNVEDCNAFRDSPGIYHGGEIDPLTNDIKWFPIKLNSISFVNLVAVIDQVRAEDDEGDKGFAFNIQENTEELAGYTVVLKNRWTCLKYLDDYCKKNRPQSHVSNNPDCVVGYFQPALICPHELHSHPCAAGHHGSPTVRNIVVG